MSKEITIYTDGSCNNHTHDRGGYGIVLLDHSLSVRGMPAIKQYAGGSYYNTTSARMEVLAIVRALQKCKPGQEITVFSDNEYAVNAVMKGWVFKWKYTNFFNRKNADLWSDFLKEYTRLHGNIELQWVRGHNGNHWNEVADILASRGGRRNRLIDHKERLS